MTGPRKARAPPRSRRRDARVRHLTRYLSLDDELLEADDLETRVLGFAAESFASIVGSGILGLEPQPSIPDEAESADD